MKLSSKGQLYALFAITVIVAALGNLSQTAVNVMMTTLTAEFEVGVDVGQWLTTLYMLVLGIVVPITTFLDRRFSDRGYMLIALAFVLLGSVLSFFATSFVLLLIGRVLQAIATGILIPSTQNIAMRRFPMGKQGTAMGISGIAMGFAPNIGPTVGSWFVAGIGWRWFFFMLAAFIVVAGIATFLLIPKDSENRQAIKLDFRSFILSAIAFGGLLTGLSDATSFGFGSVLTWLPMALGVIVLWLFVRREKRVEDPLINMDIFSSRHYKVGFWTQNLLFASFMGITLIIPLFIEGVCGGTASEAGIVLLPAAILALVCNPLGGILSDRFGQTPVTCVTGVFLVVGAGMFMFIDESTSLVYLAIAQSLRGIGISTSIGALVTWTLGGLPRPLISHGSSFSTLVRQASASFGTTAMVFCAEALPLFGLGLVWSFRLAFAVSAVFSLGVLMSSWTLMRRVDRETDEEAE